MTDEIETIPLDSTPMNFAKTELAKRWAVNDWEWVAVYKMNTPNLLYLCTYKKRGFSHISPAVSSILKQDHCSLHHNHPSSDPLSPSDYANFNSYPLLKEIWAHGHNGTSWYNMMIGVGGKFVDPGDVPETTIESFSTALGLEWDPNTRSAFRQGFALAVEEWTQGKYEFDLIGHSYQHCRQSAELQRIEECSKLVTEACIRMKSLAGSPDYSAIGSCIHQALACGNYPISLFVVQRLSATEQDMYQANCRSLENWVTSHFS